MKEETNKTNIFWTGGFDSTFRLIQLLKTTTNFVQPHYIIRHEDSTGIEIFNMIKMIRSISIKFPEVMPRLLPTTYVNEDIIPKFKDLDEEIEELRKIGKVHEQYQIMSHYCRKFNVDSIEVALTRITGEKELFKYFKTAVAFKSFTYPTIGLTKKEMLDIARKNNWDEILFQTSFCRRPKITPCGVCGPCSDAVASGMGFRFPIIPYMKARILIPFRKFYRKNYHKQDKGIFKIIKRLFENKFCFSGIVYLSLDMEHYFKLIC